MQQADGVRDVLAPSTSCDALADDLMYVIFYKLPVNTLIRFQTLSKKWNKILSTTPFIKHHYNYVTSTVGRPGAGSNYLLTYSSRDKKHLLHYDINESKSTLSIPKVLQPPTRPNHVCFVPSLSCGFHGILCLTHFDHYDALHKILIWNPVSHYSKIVPLLPEMNAHCGLISWSRTFVGFGYDDATDDYKIIVRTDNGVGQSQTTYALSLKSDKNGYYWRDITDVDGRNSWGTCASKPVALGGDIYWISSTKTTRFEITYKLLKFNLTTERVSVIQCPSYVDKHEWKVQLCLYKGSLCFFSFNHLCYKKLYTNWARCSTLENGKATTWKTLMEVPYLPILKGFSEVKPCGFTESGSDLIISSENSILGENRYVELFVYAHDRLEADYLLQIQTLMYPF